MVKIASNVSFVHLRDIRVSSSKSLAQNGGALTSGNGVKGTGGQGNGSHRGSLMPDEDALKERERAGYERGRKEAEQEHGRQMERLQAEWDATHRAGVIRILEELNKSVHVQMSEAFKSLEKHVVMLSAEAAIRLTSGIPVSADMVEAYVREAMNLVEQDTEITVVIHPEDLALLEQHQSSLLNRAGTTPILKFRPDTKITRGGCLMETRFGELDGRRETKIELLRKAVNE
jgi:flagellar biosynthesis/type III secretory pathway protein FliH